MSVFNLYFKLGFSHIIDYQAFDHILFIVTLTAVYILSDWKKVLVLITSFTIGHTVTLALSTLNIVKIDSSVVEFLIPVTILITAIGNMFERFNPTSGFNSPILASMKINFSQFIPRGLAPRLLISPKLNSIKRNSDKYVTQALPPVLFVGVSSKLYKIKYFIALFFGLIHGLGFSNYLKMLLGNEHDILKPLFAFNLGLELGQVCIVFVILLLATIGINKLNIKKREWLLVLSGVGLGVSVMLIIERLL